MSRRLAMVAVVSATVAATAATAGSAPATEVGWWTRNPGASAPPGGFQVSIGADTELSVAALRFAIPPGSITTAFLTLSEAPDGIRQDAARIKVCRTKGTWTKADGGSYDEAPVDECLERGEVPLERNAQASSWTADIEDLIPGPGTLSIKVIPEPASDSPIEPGFEVQFSTTNLAVAVAPTGGPATPAPSVIVVPPQDTGGEVVTSDPNGTITDPVLVATSAPTTATPSPDTVSDAFIPRAGTDEEKAARPWWRVAIFVPVASALGVGVARLRRTLRARGWLAS